MYNEGGRLIGPVPRSLLVNDSSLPSNPNQSSSTPIPPSEFNMTIRAPESINFDIELYFMAKSNSRNGLKRANQKLFGGLEAPTAEEFLQY